MQQALARRRAARLELGPAWRSSSCKTAENSDGSTDKVHKNGCIQTRNNASKQENGGILRCRGLLGGATGKKQNEVEEEKKSLCGCRDVVSPVCAFCLLLPSGSCRPLAVRHLPAASGVSRVAICRLLCARRHQVQHRNHATSGLPYFYLYCDNHSAHHHDLFSRFPAAQARDDSLSTSAPPTSQLGVRSSRPPASPHSNPCPIRLGFLRHQPLLRPIVARG